MENKILEDKDESCLLYELLSLKNKGNSTADAGQVEANLQEELSDHLHFRKQKYC